MGASSVAVLDKPPTASHPKHALYNIGNGRAVRLGRFIDKLRHYPLTDGL
ncbi:hypothetical protein [Mesorhizobium qingshengii]|nr:hypothetical protein [Mesorhizobium qingshengii]